MITTLRHRLICVPALPGGGGGLGDVAAAALAALPAECAAALCESVTIDLDATPIVFHPPLPSATVRYR